MSVLPAFVSVCHMCAVHAQARRGHPWDWSSRQLKAVMWVLGLKPWSLRRASGALDCLVILPASVYLFFDTGSYPLAQAGPELMVILLLQSPECCNYRYELTCQAKLLRNSL